MINLVDLGRQFQHVKDDILHEIEQVIDSGNYILGTKVEELEKKIAKKLNVSEAVSVANGTDALVLTLEALGIGKGDEVITTPFTFFASAESISRVGATPVFADVNPHTFNLEKSGLKVGSDFYLANSPERIDPGNKKFKVDEIPKVVGGITDECKNMAVSLYGNIYKKVVPVSTSEAAELTKLLENTYRFINISFINEMAILSDKLNTNIWEVIEAAATKPYGFTPYYPGPGIGGHCIPVDPLYLQWKLQQLETDSEFILLSDSTNQRIIDYIIKRTEELLGENKPFDSSTILIYGVTYKKDVADTRDSPSLKIIEKLKQKAANVLYHDPYIPTIKIGEELFASVDLTDDLISQSDCVLILADHSNIPLERILTHASLVFDTRNVTGKLEGKAKVIKLGDGSKL